MYYRCSLHSFLHKGQLRHRKIQGVRKVRESELVITNSRSFCKRCQVQVFLGAKPPELLNFPPNQKAAVAAVPQHQQQCLISVTRKRSSPIPLPDRGSQKRSGGTQLHHDPLTFLEGTHSQNLQPQQAKFPGNAKLQNYNSQDS